MKIETKYNLGDRLYSILRECIYIQDAETGKNVSFRRQWNVYPAHSTLIQGLYASTQEQQDRGDFSVTYEIDRLRGRMPDESHLFLTKQEAQAECDRRNADEKQE